MSERKITVNEEKFKLDLNAEFVLYIQIAEESKQQINKDFLFNTSTQAINKSIDLFKTDNRIKLLSEANLDSIISLYKEWIIGDFSRNADQYCKITDSELLTFEDTEERRLKRKYDTFLCSDLSIFDNYVKNFNDKDNYICNIFKKSDYEDLIFVPGNIGIVGARTSRGKTTALVSIAIDSLRQGKTVHFTTMEESIVQLQARFILAFLFYADSFENLNIDESWRLELKKKNPETNKNRFNAKKELFKYFRGEPIRDLFNNSELTKKFQAELSKAKDRLADFMKKEKLMFYNGLASETFESMYNSISTNDKGTICLLDYVQKVKPPIEDILKDNRFVMLQKIVNKLATITKEKGLILICGAQFGRSGEKFNSGAPDLFTDESFQECSAIEQIGEIEIGIGREFRDGIKHTYYAILKDRDNGEFDPSKYYELEGIENYSLFEPAKNKDNKLILWKDTNQTEEIERKKLSKADSDYIWNNFKECAEYLNEKGIMCKPPKDVKENNTQTNTTARNKIDFNTPTRNR